MRENEKTEGIELSGEERGLDKHLSVMNVWALALGCAVGWGAFVMPGNTFLPIAGPVGAVLAMGIGTVLMLVIAANFHYMAEKYPDAGGAFSYAKHIFGYDHSFLCAWAFGLAYLTVLWANATAFVLICRFLLGSVFQVGFHYQVAGYDVYFGEILLTMFVLLFFGWVSMRGKKLNAFLETCLAVFMMVGTILLFVLVLANSGGGATDFSPAFNTVDHKAEQILNIVVLAPWAFVGFEAVIHSSEELKFSKKKMFPVMGVALLSGAVIYILMTLIAVMNIPEGYANWQEYIADLGNQSGLDAVPTFHAIKASAGQWGLVLLAVTILAAVSTTMLGLYRSMSRLLFALSKDRVIPKAFSELNEDHIPQKGIFFIMLISLVIPFFGRTAIGWIVDITTISTSLAYGYVSACSYRTAKENGNSRMKLFGMIGIIVSVIFFCFPIIPNILSLSSLASESYMMLVAWSVVGFFFFRLVFQYDRENRFGKSTVVWMALVFLIFFASTMWMRQATHRTTENVVADMGRFYDQERGPAVSEEDQKWESSYLEMQMQKISNTLMTNSLIQMVFVFVSLFIMFQIFTTVRKREKRLELMRMQAEESSKAKTTFLSNMSHDIRTPMNAIVGYTNLARSDLASPEDIQNFLNKIDTSSKHLLALIDDVLEMSRIESGKMELEPAENDLFEIMMGVKDMFAMQMQAKDIFFTVDASNIKNRYVMCDKNRLNRVLLNLLSNALKFTPENGSVSVILSQWGKVENGFGDYELRVRDSGIGMSEEFAAKVFQAFERERTSTVSGIQGTGLGMAITKNIVELMDGTIRVETAEGEGTEFIVTVRFEVLKRLSGSGNLNQKESVSQRESFGEARSSAEPEIGTDSGSNGQDAKEVRDGEESAAAVSAEDSEMQKELQDNPAGEIDLNHLRVLLVEDNEINCEIATLVLEGEGITVEIAKNGQEGLDMVAASAPGHYDAVLMDVRMPVMGGYEATKKIRELENRELANIPIIAMTANAYAEDIRNAEEAGMDDHVAKPFEVEKLLSVLTEAILKRRG